MSTENNYSIEILLAAMNDMTEIVSSFIMLGSKKGALRIKDKMNNAVMQASQFPYSGVTVPEPSLRNYRMMIVEDYLMFYRIFDNENKIVFYRVLNGKLNYSQLLNRLRSENNI